MTVAFLEQQERKETRVQLVFLGFQDWMVFLATQGLLDSEANLVQKAAMAPEVIPDIQGKEELLAQEDPQVFLGKMERKEIQCSL